MSRLLPQSLAGRTIMVLILGLVATHLLTVAVFERHRSAVLSGAEEQHIAQHIASISDIVLNMPGDLRDRVVRASDDHAFRVSVTRAERVTIRAPESVQAGRLGELLSRRLRTSVDEPILVEIGKVGLSGGGAADAAVLDTLQSLFVRRLTGHDEAASLLVSIPLPEGERLDFSTVLPLAAAPGWPRVMAMTGTFLLGVLLLSIWAVRRLLMPVRWFADWTTAFAHDPHAPALPETGPPELREAARAFNEMQHRIIQLLENRTEMLAAISHDLRTPLTTVRLRAETIEEPDIRGRILATLAEMDRMLAATLAFAREGADCEPVSTTDLGALLDAICDDLCDAGHNATCSMESGILLQCRPIALRRALGNLIENAARYGRKAEVSAGVDARTAAITIDDEGPGIPPAEMERVFLPFYRLDASRNRETGGLGLGMSIAKTIIEANGGAITLVNREGGGLRVRVSLPLRQR